MTLPRRRLARPISSKRYLALRHGRAIIEAQEREAAAKNGLLHLLEKDEKLADGFARLHSAQVPGLQAGGTYNIETKQTITVDSNDLSKGNIAPGTTQQFEVQAPRFSLPQDAVYSVYPPPGHSATVDCLPHVVLNDPELAWERVGSWDSEELPHPADWDRNRVPWLAVLVFTQEELRLSPDELNSVFEGTSLKDGKAAQTNTFAVKMPNEDLQLLKKANVLAPYEDVDSTTEPTTDMIFVQPAFFNSIFANYDDTGAKIPRNGIKDQTPAPTVAQHRLLAHVRRMNTTGMAHAGEEDDIADRDYGIIVCNRTGPLGIQVKDKPDKPAEPQVVAAHLVSIEGIEAMRPFPLDTKAVSRIGLVSLHSWTYESLPPDSIGPADALINLGKLAEPLRKSFDVPADATPGQKRMCQRLDDGYALSKFRFQTGEDTVSLYRGPLSPKKISAEKLELLSNSGMNLQILDNDLGIMDITYSAAWQLGRTLAIANRAYTTALTRVRKAILTGAADSAQKQSLELADMSVTASGREQLVQHIIAAVCNLRNLSRCHETDDTGRLDNQWSQSLGPVPDLSYSSQSVIPYVDDALINAAKKVASSTDGDQKDPAPYDEYNTPYSPDWVLVLRFVLDLYHLVDIPLHYLLPDPAQLPAESLRFFIIDNKWVDALVDGALCLGNQGTLSLEGVDEQPEDTVRPAIKEAINRYFAFENSKLKYKQPVPKFGFLMRSNVVTQFPDLKVNVSPEQDKNKAPLLLRHETIGKDMMIGMFGDVKKPDGVLEALTFTLPPHQQFFSVGRHVKASDISLSYKRNYTAPGHDDDKDRNKPFTDDPLTWERGKATPNNRPAVFVWGSQADANDVRILLVENLVKDLYSNLKTKLTSKSHVNDLPFDEICPTSAMLGFQLNAPAWQLVMQLTPPSVSSHLLTYPKRPKAQGVSEIAKWPKKEHVPLLSAAELAASIKGLQLDLKPPYYQPLLPSEFLIHERSEEDRKAWRKAHRHDVKDHQRSSSSVSIQSLSSFSSTDSKFNIPSPFEGGLPTFACTVRPATDSKSTTITSLPTRQDLVFSIIYKGEGNGFALENIVIDVPLKGGDVDPWLMESYTSNSATMVSNLRFNVRVTYSGKSKTLKLLIVPRTVKGYVWLNRFEEDVSDASVVLNGVVVRKVTEPLDVPCTVTPGYTNSPTAPTSCWARLVPS